MCSYNKLNGPYACGSGAAQNDILRKEMGFKGFITSDWGGTHSTLFVNEGLDMEMPGAVEGAGGNPTYFLARASVPAAGGTAPTGAGGAGGGPAAVAPGTAVGSVAPEEGAPAPRGNGNRRGGEAPIGMLAAVSDGRIGEAALNTAVGRILVQMDKFGYLDKPPKMQVTAEDHDFNTPVIRRTAEQAAVLLENDGNVLPLRDSELGSVAFIGPGAGQTIAIGMPGEEGLGLPERQISPVSAIEQMTGKKITYRPANDMTGVAVPAAMLSHDGKPGLLHTDVASGQSSVDAQLD